MEISASMYSGRAAWPAGLAAAGVLRCWGARQQQHRPGAFLHAMMNQHIQDALAGLGKSGPHGAVCTAACRWPTHMPRCKVNMLGSQHPGNMQAKCPSCVARCIYKALPCNSNILMPASHSLPTVEGHQVPAKEIGHPALSWPWARSRRLA